MGFPCFSLSKPTSDIVTCLCSEKDQRLQLDAKHGAVVVATTSWSQAQDWRPTSLLCVKLTYPKVMLRLDTYHFGMSSKSKQHVTWQENPQMVFGLIKVFFLHYINFMITMPTKTEIV